MSCCSVLRSTPHSLRAGRPEGSGRRVSSNVRASVRIPALRRLRFYAPRVGVGLREQALDHQSKDPTSIPPYRDCFRHEVTANPVYPGIDPMNRGITALERTPYAVLTCDAHGAVIGRGIPGAVQARDLHHGAGVRGVDEQPAAQVDAYVVEVVEEDEVARCQLVARDVRARAPQGDGVV